MHRLNLYISPEQFTYLESLDTLTVSEHIRRAIDAYIRELKGLKVSASQS